KIGEAWLEWQLTERVKMTVAPHPEDAVTLNDADLEEEDEQGAGRREDDVSSSRRV
ncbi:hypothetical protein M9458_019990, partial [Cirrhinus mrigala]